MFLIYCIIIFIMMGSILLLSHFLGPRHQDKRTGEVYESGIALTKSPLLMVPTKFYVIAVLFVLFDLESVFIFGWASCAKILGKSGYFTILIFSINLLMTLYYLIKTGAMDFGPKLRKPEFQTASKEKL